MHPLIVIPARLASTRLPNKPLALIAGEPMIVQVWRRAMESGVGDVIVACDGEDIAEAIRAVGGVAIVTDPDLPSGSDRVWSAVKILEGTPDDPRDRPRSEGGAGGDPVCVAHERKESSLAPRKKHDVIINVQGDLPTLDPALLQQLIAPWSGSRLQTPDSNTSADDWRLTTDDSFDILTLAAPITREEEKASMSVVKPVLVTGDEWRVTSEEPSRHSPPVTCHSALNFLRGPSPEPMYHHIGVYAYRREALEKFVSLPPSAREIEHKLEQLRALDAGMRIGCVLVNTVPLGVDTPEDLEEARRALQ